MIPDAACLGSDKESIQVIFYLFCVRLSKAAPFCENYTKLYFDAKHLKMELNRGEIFGPAFHKKCPFWPIFNTALNFQNIYIYIYSQHLSITDTLTWSLRCLLSKGLKLCNIFVSLKFNTSFHCQSYLLFQTRQIL